MSSIKTKVQSLGDPRTEFLLTEPGRTREIPSGVEVLRGGFLTVDGGGMLITYCECTFVVTDIETAGASS